MGQLVAVLVLHCVSCGIFVLPIVQRHLGLRLGVRVRPMRARVYALTGSAPQQVPFPVLCRLWRWDMPRCTLQPHRGRAATKCSTCVHAPDCLGC